MQADDTRKDATKVIVATMPIVGVFLFLALVTDTIQGQTMQGQQRTRNFSPIQVFAFFHFSKLNINVEFGKFCAGGQQLMEP